MPFVSGDVIPRAPRTMTFRTIQRVRLAQANWTGTDIFGAYSYQLSDLPGAANFTSLWDEYRITGVALVFEPILLCSVLGSVTVASGVTTTIINPPQIWCANDYTDIVTPAENVLLEHENLIDHGPAIRNITHTVVPVPLVAAYQGAFTGYAHTEAVQWIEINSAGVQHYGTKWGIIKGQNASAVPCTYRIYGVYEVSFRRVVG